MIALYQIDNNMKLWKGAELRKYNVGLNLPDDQNFYDYILACLP